MRDVMSEGSTRRMFVDACVSVCARTEGKILKHGLCADCVFRYR